MAMPAESVDWLPGSPKRLSTGRLSEERKGTPNA